jgi:hypothetical protein
MIAVKRDRTENWLTQSREEADFLFLVFPSTALLMRNDDYSI